MALSLHALRLFVVVAEELHFGRAAARLHMAQPPLSQQIRQLEANVGADLFARTTRSVQLTEAGRVLFDRARQLLADADAAEQAVLRAAHGETGRISLGFTSSAAYRLLPRILSAYRSAYPAVAFDFTEATSAEQWDALRSGKLDVALLRLSTLPVETDFDAFEADREPMLLALPLGHPLAADTAVAPAALDRLPMVGFSAVGSTYFRDLSQKIYHAAGVQPRIEQESVLPTILALVEAGLGAALVPASAAEMRSARVTYRPLQPAKSRRGGTIDAVLHCARPHASTNMAALVFVRLLATMSASPAHTGQAG